MLKPMEVRLTAEQQAFARLAMANGRLRSEEEAVEQALLLWEERERGRLAVLSTLSEEQAALARGEGRALTADNLDEFAGQIKHRGRAVLASRTAAR